MDDHDFESQYEAELEMLREESEACESAPSSRRVLSLATPDLPPGASRKRPIEESPLPSMPSDTPDHPRKVARLTTSDTSLSSIPEEPLSPHIEGNGLKSTTQTPVRHINTDVRNIFSTEEGTIVHSSPHVEVELGTVDKVGGGDNGSQDDFQSRPYTPPSPYTLSPSPSSPQSPTLNIDQSSTSKRRKLDGRSRTETRSTSSQATPTRNQFKSPGKAIASRSVPHTPGSASRYRRSLDLSQLESKEPHQLPNPIIQRFEAAYQSLTSNELSASHVQDSEEGFDALFSDPDSPSGHELRPNLGNKDILTQESLVASPRRQPRPNVLTRAPPGPHISVTGSDGSRVYLKLRGGAKYGGRGELSTRTRLPSQFQLLSVPFARLRDTVEEERRKKLIEQSNTLLRSLTSTYGNEKEESQSLFGDSEDPNAIAVEGEKPSGVEYSLWVDKYAPKHYTELLSDDGINRTLLSWLKLWDEAVFGRPAFSTPKGGGRKGEERGQKKGANMMGKGKNYENATRVEYRDPTAFASSERKQALEDIDTFKLAVITSQLRALDEKRRPKIKLALLCGAPGLGKTTLAHIIARHAGYNVVEMNASDDRSPEVFQHRIEAATQMQAVLTAETKPNCLIIDEIDGAPTAAINVLLDIVKKKETFKKKKKGGIVLSRPIICICNDQYAPSLRQLRQYAMVLYFPSTVTSRLAGRLHRVTKKEHMTASMSTLMALCEKTDSDIRACLNTLQFIQCRQGDLTLAAVQSANVGQKDAQKSLFSLWKEIFQLPSGKKHTLNQGPLRFCGALDQPGPGGGAHVESSLSTTAMRFYSILSAASATGEFEKVAQGLFENYLHIRFKDPSLEAVSLAQDWMVFHDTLQHRIKQSQEFHFIPYLSYLSVAFHFLFAAPTKPEIKYPHTSFEVFQRHQHSCHLLSSLLLEVPPHVKRSVNTHLLATEMLSPIMEIISPSFRPVSIQLYTMHEKHQLADLVDTMISYNLTYRQERGADGQYTYILDPNVEELCRFSGLSQRKQLSYSAKQLIAREIDVEKMRRSERALSDKVSVKSSASEAEPAVDPPANPPSPVVQSKKPSKRKYNPQPVVKEEKHAMDFFGRKLKAKSGHSTCSLSGTSSSTHPLWFRFNEGFSNAVRKPIRIQELL